MLWQDLVLKQNIELWPQPPVSLFDLKHLLKELKFGEATQITLICDN